MNAFAAKEMQLIGSDHISTRKTYISNKDIIETNPIYLLHCEVIYSNSYFFFCRIVWESGDFVSVLSADLLCEYRSITCFLSHTSHCFIALFYLWNQT